MFAIQRNVMEKRPVETVNSPENLLIAYIPFGTERFQLLKGKPQF